MHDDLCQRQLALGRTQLVVSIERRDSQLQRRGIGEPDVLAREPHQPPRDVEPVLARREHAREPIKAGVGIRIAQALVQRRDQVEVLVAGAVVAQVLPRQRAADVVGVDRTLTRGGGRGRDLECGERATSVAIGGCGQQVHGLVTRRDAAREPALIRERAADQRTDGLGIERAQHEHACARQERRVHLEAGVLGGRSDQHDVAALDMREERVLLRLVEAVDLVDEQDRRLTGPAPRLRRTFHDLLHFLDAREHRRDLHERHARGTRDQACERGLAGAGRAPQDDAREMPPLAHQHERAALLQEMLLPDQLLERPRPHAVGERRVRSGFLESAGQTRGYRPTRCVPEQVAVHERGGSSVGAGSALCTGPAPCWLSSAATAAAAAESRSRSTHASSSRAASSGVTGRPRS